MSYAQPVAAEDPEALLGQVLLVLQDLLSLGRTVSLEGGDQGLGGSIVGLGVGLGLDELVDGSVQSLVLALHGDNLLDQVLADGLVADLHAEAMLGVVLEQGVDPGGTTAGLLVGGVRADGSGAAPDGGAAGGVGDEHLLAEQLG